MGPVCQLAHGQLGECAWVVQHEFANALLGNFKSYTESNTRPPLYEGTTSVEWYLQDNWKVTNRLTLDYGLRFVHQQPQYDRFKQASNFFPAQFTAANAQVLYVAGCSNGASVAWRPWPS